MHELERLIAAKRPDRKTIAAFLKRHTFPLVESGRATFVFHGRADSVYLRHFIFGLPSSQPFQRVDGTDLWHVTIELPRRSRIEYKIERVKGDEREWIMDPLNPLTARDPYGANSVCHGEGYETPEWTQPDPEARPGRIEETAVSSAAYGADFPFKLYIPARFRRGRRYPLLIVHDGEDYLRYSSLQTVLDNLIHRLEIPSMIVALVGSQERLEDYAATRRHGNFLARELLPALEQRLPLMRRSAMRGLMGASFGAVASLSAAWRHPGLFGRLLLQSGSFAFADIGQHNRGPVFDPVAEFVNEFRERPGRPADRIFVSCGIYESLIYENRSLVPLLQSTGMDVRYVEARDGHNWENWRDRLREGLSWLFPGPLWMVYE
jgi:enterochelin esterase family protein